MRRRVCGGGRAEEGVGRVWAMRGSVGGVGPWEAWVRGEARVRGWGCVTSRCALGVQGLLRGSSRFTARIDERVHVAYELVGAALDPRRRDDLARRAEGATDDEEAPTGLDVGRHLGGPGGGGTTA